VTTAPSPARRDSSPGLFDVGNLQAIEVGEQPFRVLIGLIKVTVSIPSASDLLPSTRHGRVQLPVPRGATRSHEPLSSFPAGLVSCVEHVLRSPSVRHAPVGGGIFAGSRFRRPSGRDCHIWLAFCIATIRSVRVLSARLISPYCSIAGNYRQKVLLRGDHVATLDIFVSPVRTAC